MTNLLEGLKAVGLRLSQQGVVHHPPQLRANGSAPPQASILRRCFFLWPTGPLLDAKQLVHAHPYLRPRRRGHSSTGAAGGIQQLRPLSGPAVLHRRRPHCLRVHKDERPERGSDITRGGGECESRITHSAAGIPDLRDAGTWRDRHKTQRKLHISKIPGATKQTCQVSTGTTTGLLSQSEQIRVLQVKKSEPLKDIIFLKYHHVKHDNVSSVQKKYSHQFLIVSQTSIKI